MVAGIEATEAACGPDTRAKYYALADELISGGGVAEFWINLQGTEVHIRYFPVLGARGEYLGCLETVQDITAIKALTGERRLLDEA